MSKWKWDFITSDLNGESHYYVEIDGKRYWARDAQEIAKLHNAEMAKLAGTENVE